MDILKHHSLLIELLSLFSVLTFTGSLIAIPWIIGKLPADYFIRHRKMVEKRHEKNPLLAKIILVVRNLFGILFFLAGVVMLFLPGQGIITILIGISFMDFPKKNNLVDYLIKRPRVVKVLNWIRLREKKPPFEFSAKGRFAP